MSSDTPTVTVLSTGGTIASTRGEGGKSPSKAGDDLIDAVPGLDDHAEFAVESVCQVSGFDMTWERVSALKAAAEAAAAESDGLVVTHGTDTMAESAYFLDLTTDLDVPVAFTGSQRSFDDVGTDGPPNLLEAVRTVTHDRVGSGVYLVFNDHVHAARDVVKSHTSKLETFTAPDRGPVAEFTPTGIRFFREPRSYSATADVGAGDVIEAEVPIVTTALGVGGDQVRRAVDAEVDGIVVAGTGLGNTTAALCDAIEVAIDAGVPVVVSSRCHAGATAPLYGKGGGGKTLERLGVVEAGDLPPWKARIKLAVALAGGSFDETFFTEGVKAPASSN